MGCGYHINVLRKKDTLVLIIVRRFSFIEIRGECGYLEPSHRVVFAKKLFCDCDDFSGFS